MAPRSSTTKRGGAMKSRTMNKPAASRTTAAKRSTTTAKRGTRMAARKK